MIKGGKFTEDLTLIETSQTLHAQPLMIQTLLSLSVAFAI